MCKGLDRQIIWKLGLRDSCRYLDGQSRISDIHTVLQRSCLIDGATYDSGITRCRHSKVRATDCAYGKLCLKLRVGTHCWPPFVQPRSYCLQLWHQQRLAAERRSIIVVIPQTPLTCQHQQIQTRCRGTLWKGPHVKSGTTIGNDKGRYSCSFCCTRQICKSDMR